MKLMTDGSPLIRSVASGMNWRPLTERSIHMNNPTKTLVLATALAGVLVSTPARLNAQGEAHRVRNIVLVHGAWADGSGWNGVYDILTKDGYKVSIVQEPETSFKDDVAATRRILALQDGPSILVAHSYGGAVIQLCVDGPCMNNPSGAFSRLPRGRQEGGTA
jgi:pimeloyl-ACP methyl ester carboxylesterase